MGLFVTCVCVWAVTQVVSNGLRNYNTNPCCDGVKGRYVSWGEMQTMMYLKISLSDFFTVFAARCRWAYVGVFDHAAVCVCCWLTPCVVRVPQVLGASARLRIDVCFGCCDGVLHDVLPGVAVPTRHVKVLEHEAVGALVRGSVGVDLRVDLVRWARHCEDDHVLLHLEVP